MNPLRQDPTKTLTLRKRFSQAANRRFLQLRKSIIDSVDKNDCFGAKPRPVHMQINKPVPYRAYEYLSQEDKINEFMTWLATQVDKGILEVETGPGQGNAPWAKTYINSAYRKGIVRGVEELDKAGVAIASKQALIASFSGSFHADRVAYIYTRVFENLKGITTEMAEIIRETLALGMGEGRGPYQIARMLAARIESKGLDLSFVDSMGRKMPAARRARLLARTEIVRAHHLANIDVYESVGVAKVKVLAEWSTAGDDRVCPDCDSYAGMIMTLDEIRDLIPFHPSCRCVALPFIEGVSK